MASKQAQDILQGVWAQRQATMEREGREPAAIALTAASLEVLKRDWMSSYESAAQSALGRSLDPGVRLTIFGIPLVVLS